MMIESNKLYIFILVWVTLTFIQGHSYMRNFFLKSWCPFYPIDFSLDYLGVHSRSQENWNLCSHSEVKKMFMTVDYEREMALKKPCMANMDRLNSCSSC